MTNAEAIETLKANYPDACYEQLREAVDTAIEALEKQIPKELIAEGDGYADGEMVYDSFYCPSCDYHMEDYEVENYCPNCGQAIDWGGDEE